MTFLRNNWLSKRAAPPLAAPISIPPSQNFDGNDGAWSTFPIQVGTPPQNVDVLISTASSQTWVPLPEGCTQSDPANCSTSRGGLFQPNSSNTWVQNQNVAGGLSPILLEADLYDTDTGLYGYDTISLGGQGTNGPTLDRQVVARVAGKGFYLGSFGLSPQPVMLPNTTAQLPDFLSQLNQSGSIPSLSWNYTAGNPYRPGPVYGSLILGGYDDSRFEPNDISFAINKTNPRNFEVDIGTIFLNTDNFTTMLATSNESITAFIDSTTPYIWLPMNICQQFEEAFGITWDDSVQAYLVNDTLHSALQNQDTSVIINMGNPSTPPGQGVNITLPYAAFDLLAEAPLVNNASRYFPLMRAANESQFVLGRTFLQEAYLLADFERNNFSISQCSWESDAKPHIVAIKPPGFKTPSNHHKLSAGAIAGIVIGAIVLVIIAILLGVLFKKRGLSFKRKRNSEVPNQTNIAPIELDAPEKDGYMAIPRDIKDHPQSPELQGVEHKGHELAGGADAQQNQQRYELAATERRSQALSSPISLMTDRSDVANMHQRQLSNPVSLTSELSDTARDHQRKQSDPMTPMTPTTPTRQRSDATRLHRREVSDPISVTNGEGNEASEGGHRVSEPVSLARETSGGARSHRRGLSDPVSVFSEMFDK